MRRESLWAVTQGMKPGLLNPIWRLLLEPRCGRRTLNKADPPQKVNEYQVKGQRSHILPATWSLLLWTLTSERKKAILPIQGTARHLSEECSSCLGKFMHFMAAGFSKRKWKSLSRVWLCNPMDYSNSEMGSSLQPFCARNIATQKWKCGFQNIPTH